MSTQKFATKALHAGHDVKNNGGTRAVPIYQTTSYVFDDADDAAGRFNLSVPGFIYTRLNNPTNDILEQRLADLEGGVGAVATASGTATKTANASGSLASAVATVSGTATRTAKASGSLESAVSTVSGAATKVALASGSLESSVSTVSGTATQAAIASGSLQASVATVAGTATSSVKEQAAFRFYADGTESGSSVLADQNVDITIAKEVIFQLRVGMQSTGDLNAETATLQYRPTSGGTWRNV